MIGQRKDEKPQDAHEPLIYYRRRTDKIFIGSFLLGSLIFCYFLYTSLKESNLILFTVIVFFSIIFGFLVSRILTSLYSFFSKRS